MTTPSLTLGDAKALEKAYGVEAIAPSNQTFARVSVTLEEKFAVVQGVTPEYLSVMNQTLASGQFIAQHDVSSRSLVIVLGSDAANSLFGTQDPIGQTVKIKGYRFTVVGTLEAVGGTNLGISNGQCSLCPDYYFPNPPIPAADRFR